MDGWKVWNWMTMVLLTVCRCSPLVFFGGDHDPRPIFADDSPPLQVACVAQCVCVCVFLFRSTAERSLVGVLLQADAEPGSGDWRRCGNGFRNTASVPEMSIGERSTAVVVHLCLSSPATTSARRELRDE